MEIITKLDSPYLHIEKTEPNKFYVSILQNLYSGGKSELTAVLQYVYQTHFFESVKPNVAKVVLDIAVVEMEHLELLAEAIISYGGDPKYVTNRSMFYTSRVVEYNKDYVSMLLSDLTQEKLAIKAYKDAGSMVKDPKLKEFLYRIQLDEELHYKAFESMLVDAKSLMI